MKLARLAHAGLAVSVAFSAAACSAPKWVRPEVKLTEPGCREAPDRSVLEEVRQKVAAAKALGKTPLVLFDIDDTLVDTATRTRAIFTEALRSPSAPAGADQAAERLDYLCLGEYVLDIEGNLDRAEFEPAIRRYVHEVWERAWFTDRYLERSVPFRGAARWVADLRARGATIVYLTNRNARKLRDGTLRALDARGFPVERDGALLVMQAGDHEDSLSWKEEEAEKLAAKGAVVATFENEPANVRMYRKLFPGAVSVLMVSRHRPRQPAVGDETRCIVDYEDRL
jgi:acid phosphatase class B